MPEPSARQPDRYPAYAADRNRDLRTGRQTGSAPPDWQPVARQAGIDPQALQACVESGEGDRLIAASRARADTLELVPGTVAALMENRLLLRRAAPRDFMQLWQEGSRP